MKLKKIPLKRESKTKRNSFNGSVNSNNQFVVLRGRSQNIFVCLCSLQKSLLQSRIEKEIKSMSKLTPQIKQQLSTILVWSNSLLLVISHAHSTIFHNLFFYCGFSIFCWYKNILAPFFWSLIWLFVSSLESETALFILKIEYLHWNKMWSFVHFFSEQHPYFFFWLWSLCFFSVLFKSPLLIDFAFFVGLFWVFSMACWLRPHNGIFSRNITMIGSTRRDCVHAMHYWKNIQIWEVMPISLFQSSTECRSLTGIFTQHSHFHLDALAMKALILNSQGPEKREEAYKLARKAIRIDITSHLCIPFDTLCDWILVLEIKKHLFFLLFYVFFLLVFFYRIKVGIYWDSFTEVKKAIEKLQNVSKLLLSMTKFVLSFSSSFIWLFRFFPLFSKLQVNDFLLLCFLCFIGKTEFFLACCQI